jgi:hypothetical protein
VGSAPNESLPVNSNDRTRVLLQLGDFSGCVDHKPYGSVISIWTIWLGKIRMLLAYANVAHDNSVDRFAAFGVEAAVAHGRKWFPS